MEVLSMRESAIFQTLEHFLSTAMSLLCLNMLQVEYLLDFHQLSRCNWSECLCWTKGEFLPWMCLMGCICCMPRKSTLHCKVYLSLSELCHVMEIGRSPYSFIMNAVLLLLPPVDLCFSLEPMCYVLAGTHCSMWAQGICGFKVLSGSMVWWFRWGLNDQVWTEDTRRQWMRKSKTKTKLRSTTDTEVILIVERPQLIVNKCTQVCHYES